MTSALLIVCPHCDSINCVPRERLRQRGKCGFCHRAALRSLARSLPGAMAPIFEQAAAELEPDVRLIKVDSDAAPELLQRFSIQSIPTLMIVHRGREVARKSGVMPLPQLLAWTRACRQRQGVTGHWSIPPDHLRSNLDSHPFANFWRLVLPSGR